MWSSIAMWSGLTLGWWGLLWLLIPSEWAVTNPGSLLMLHLAPPPALGLGVRAWERLGSLRLEEEAQQAEVQAAEASAQADRAARARHVAQLAERQQMLECRALHCIALPADTVPAWLDETQEGWSWRRLEADELAEGLEQGADALRAGLAQEVLAALYACAPGAAWLPVYTESPTEEAPMTWLARVQGWVQAQGRRCLTQNAPHADVRLLAGQGALAARVQQIFELQPELPGVVVLAADGAALQGPLLEPEDVLPPGGLACVGLLFLRQGLDEDGHARAAVLDSDPYRPYWEKRFVRPVPAWGAVPLEYQPGLAGLPVLARLARPGVADGLPQRRGQQLARGLAPRLEEALVNAALQDLPFCPEEARPELNRAPELAWLVHNCGPVDQAGTRLAAVCNTLSLHQAELDPVEQASNSVTEWGETGAATPSLLAALAITHARRLGQPVLMAQFQADAASLGIVLPPERPPESPPVFEESRA